MAHLTNGLVLSLQKISGNAGRLCYQSIVNASNITATSFLTTGSTSFPASNMANPATAFGWEASSTADQTITILNAAATPIDYVGIARHNLNQPGLEIRVRFDGSTVAPYSSVSEAQALLFLFASASPSTIQIDIRGATNAAKIAVVYVGQSVQLERDIYVGHTPINYGRDRSVVNGVSQSGEFLGEIVTNQSLSTNVSLQNLTPIWYRENLDPYFRQSPRLPCFWAWRPLTYATEVGYCWVEGNPRPVNQRSNGMMSISWNFRGIE